MELYPAIDLRGGRCVRLRQGAFARETAYRDDPVAVAKEFEAAGCAWVHVVDLDAARGDGDNRAAVAALAEATGLSVQYGGGVRDERSAEALLALGVARLVVGTAAVERPALVAALGSRFPGRVALSLDHREGEVAVRGWTEGSGVPLLDVLDRARAPGLAALVVTDISRDGTLAGPDLAGLQSVVVATDIPVIASGGVAALDDLRRLAAVRAGGRRLAGAIVGRALYEGVFTVEEALGACAASV
jgi:phosphoribosylformimino-5-aminoimidazole carboxamide ribotide isomerase